MQAALPTYLDNSFVKNVMNLNKSCIYDTGKTIPSESCKEVIGSTITVLIWTQSYPMCKVAWTAAWMPGWISERLQSVLLLGTFNAMISGIVAVQNPNAAGWLNKWQISWEGDICPTNETGKSRILTWHCSLELASKEALASGLPRNVSNFDISRGAVKMESRPCSNSSKALSIEKWSLQLSSSGSGLSWTPCPSIHGKYVMGNKTYYQPGMNKIVNLLPSHHTRNTRFHSQNQLDSTIIGCSKT